MKQIRAVCEGHPELTAAVLDSIQPSIDLLENRFQSVMLHNEPLHIGEVATEEDVDNVFSQLSRIDSKLTQDMTTKVAVLKCEQLCTYLEEHSRSRHYVFQLKKCLNAPINEILRNKVCAEIDGKIGDYQRADLLRCKNSPEFKGHFDGDSIIKCGSC